MCTRIRLQRRIVRQHLERERLQGVAGEYCHRIAEYDMAGRPAAAQGIVVHRRQIVVDERIGVDDLDRGRRRVEPFKTCAEGAADGVDEDRPQTFAVTEHGIAHRAVQVARRLMLRRQHVRERGVGARAERGQYRRSLELSPWRIRRIGQ